MSKIIRCAAIAAAIVGVLPFALADATGPEQSPGLVSIDVGDLFAGREPKVDVSVPKPLLTLMLSAAAESAPVATAGKPEANAVLSDLGPLLSMLDAVRVQIYEGDDSSEPESDRKEGEADVQSAAAEPTVSDFIGRIVQDLRGKGWEPIVSIPEEDSCVEILGRMTEAGGIAGIAGLIGDDSGELVFINVAGQIDPAKAGAVLGKLGVLSGGNGLEGIQGTLQECMKAVAASSAPPGESKQADTNEAKGAAQGSTP